MSPLELYPAIDLRAGRCVRLRQGDYDDETIYGDDPVAVAESFVAQGARWIHVVDLDAARSGDPVNRPVVGAIVAAAHGSARVQSGGGIRGEADAHAMAALGVSRVVMGTAAVVDPALVDRVADIIDVAVGLDHRDGTLAVHGWTQPASLTVDEALQRYQRASAFVVTEIGRDGMLNGPDIAGLTRAVERSTVPIIASGGVASLADLRALAAIGGLAGIISGKAIYEGRFTVRAALDTLSAAQAVQGMLTIEDES
jgi:phosphoribosylformimino-5-aminoimidazole carboxamide ribotide isomerase